MKKISLILLSLVFILSVLNHGHAQAAPQTVTLKDNKLFVKTNFVCAGVIDKRIVKSNIGYVRKGLENRKTRALLNGDFTETIHNHINGMIKPSAYPERIFIVFHEISIREEIINLSKKGACEIEIEFVQQIDSSYYSLGIYSTLVEKFNLGVTKSHSLALSKCLQSCLNDFVQSNWLRNASRVKININSPAPSYDYQSIPEKGGYLSFIKLVKKEAIDNYDFTLINKNSDPSGLRYKIKDKTTRYEAGNIPFISDGIHFYINASVYCDNNYFVRAKQTGRYIYIEDSYSDKGATLAYGLIGAALSNKLRGMVLDTANGEISLLTEYHLLFLLKDYPDIKKSYEKSKREHREREGALLSLNNKFDNF